MCDLVQLDARYPGVDEDGKRELRDVGASIGFTKPPPPPYFIPTAMGDAFLSV